MHRLTHVAVPSDKAFLVTGIPDTVDDVAIYGVHQTGQVWGIIQIKEKVLHYDEKHVIIFCVCSEVIDPKTVPTSVLGEGKTLDEPVSEMGAATPKPLNVISAPSSEALLQAVGQVLGRVMKPISKNSTSQRLRTFSRVNPIPVGEDDFENWIDTATQMVRDWLCSEVGKRKIITESLRGPALDAIKVLHVRSSKATVTTYLNVLEIAYRIIRSVLMICTINLGILYNRMGKSSLSTYIE
ncbi:hypothetical protein FKM82_006849 [Ascaphus truei]